MAAVPHRDQTRKSLFVTRSRNADLLVKAPDSRCSNILARIVSLVCLTSAVPAQLDFTNPGLALSSDCDLFKIRFQTRPRRPIRRLEAPDPT
jgi:hypothetical protein